MSYEFIDLLSGQIKLNAVPACVDCGLRMRRIFSDEVDVYLVCPSCRTGMEVPGIYLENHYQHQHEQYQNDMEVIRDFERSY